MKVFVYVEGRSDAIALRALLAPTIQRGRTNRVTFDFLPTDGKGRLLANVPMKAARELGANPANAVVALPDLYPARQYSGSLAHSSAQQLQDVLRSAFDVAAKQVGVPAERRPRFRAHCLKHDLEALLLAVPDLLRKRLRTTDRLVGQWSHAVEDQDEDRPPKAVVNELFRKYRKERYAEAVDAAAILRKARLEDVTAACPQCFAPFVQEMEMLAAGEIPV